MRNIEFLFYLEPELISAQSGARKKRTTTLLDDCKIYIVKTNFPNAYSTVVGF